MASIGAGGKKHGPIRLGSKVPHSISHHDSSGDLSAVSNSSSLDDIRHSAPQPTSKPSSKSRGDQNASLPNRMVVSTPPGSSGGAARVLAAPPSRSLATVQSPSVPTVTKTKNAFAFGQLVVANTKNQQVMLDLQAQLDSVTEELTTSRGVVAKLTADLTTMTQALSSTERDLNEMQRGNHLLRERFEEMQLSGNTKEHSWFIERQGLEKKLAERSQFASFLYQSCSKLAGETMQIVFDHFSFKDSVFRSLTKDLVVHSIRDTQVRSDTSHTHQLTLLLERHRQELDLKEETHKADLAKQEATHQLQLQSLESQLGDLQRRFFDQGVMIDQQRHQEAILRGVLPPDQQNITSALLPPRSRSPAASHNSSVASITQQREVAVVSSCTAATRTSTTTGHMEVRTPAQEALAQIQQGQQQGQATTRSQSPPSPSQLPRPPPTLGGPVRSSSRSASPPAALSTTQQREGSAGMVLLSSPDGGNFGVEQVQGNYSSSLSSGQQALPVQATSQMDSVDRGLAACLRSLAQSARR